jgi:hypothetical protein
VRRSVAKVWWRWQEGGREDRKENEGSLYPVVEEERKEKEERVRREREMGKGGVGWRLGKERREQLEKRRGLLNGVLGFRFRFEDPMWSNSYSQLCNSRILNNIMICA